MMEYVTYDVIQKFHKQPHGFKKTTYTVSIYLAMLNNILTSSSVASYIMSVILPYQLVEVEKMVVDSRLVK